MLPAIRVTGGSYHFTAAGWVQLSALGPSATGANVSGCVMITNPGTTTAYFGFGQEAVQPVANPGPYPTGSTSVWGNIPIPAGQAIIVSQPENNQWWGASAVLDVTPVELIRT